MAKFNAAFWKWFKGSKVVDADGQPLVVYHGTRSKFDEFKTPAYFSSAPVGTYAGGEGGRFIQAYLRIINPLEWGGPPQYVFARDVRDAVKKGHDGIIQRARGRVDYIVFAPTQIKSVSNDGTWDADDTDIRSNPAAVASYLWDTKYAKFGEDITGKFDTDFKLWEAMKAEWLALNLRLAGDATVIEMSSPDGASKYYIHQTVHSGKNKWQVSYTHKGIATGHDIHSSREAAIKAVSGEGSSPGSFKVTGLRGGTVAPMGKNPPDDDVVGLKIVKGGWAGLIGVAVPFPDEYSMTGFSVKMRYKNEPAQYLFYGERKDLCASAVPLTEREVADNEAVLAPAKPGVLYRPLWR